MVYWRILCTRWTSRSNSLRMKILLIYTPNLMRQKKLSNEMLNIWWNGSKSNLIYLMLKVSKYEFSFQICFFRPRSHLFFIFFNKFLFRFFNHCRRRISCQLFDAVQKQSGKSQTSSSFILCLQVHISRALHKSDRKHGRTSWMLESCVSANIFAKPGKICGL